MHSFALLLGTLLLGTLVLRLFGLSLPEIQLAGGAVVCGLGWKLLNDEMLTGLRRAAPLNMVGDTGEETNRAA